MKVKIEIDTQTFVRFWLVVIGFILAALALYSARTALIIIGAAIFLAIALSPSVNWLAKKFKSKSRVLSTAIAYVAVIIFLSIVVFLVVPPIVDQTVKFAHTVPNLINSATKQYSGLNSIIAHYNLQPEFNKAILSVKESASQLTAGIGSNLIMGIGSIFAVFTAGLLTLVLAFLMLVEGPTWLNRLWSIYRDKEVMESHSNTLTRMYYVVTGYVTGQVFVSSIAGTIGGVLVFILSLVFNIPLNLAIPAAAIMFVLSLIPMFGELTGATIVCAILALNNITAAIIFIIFFVLYSQFEGNFIVPKVQSKRIKLTPLAVLFSITIGIYLFGIVGAIISIPVAGCVRVLAEDYSVRLKKKR